MLDLFADVLKHAGTNAVRARRHRFEILRLAVAGHEIENPRHIAANCRIGGEERQVGINPRRLRMIIAGADMAVGGDLGSFSPDHQTDLGVRLQLDEAVDDMHTGLFHVTGEVDVGGFIEAGFELDDRRHRLAGVRCFLQRLDDRAFLAQRPVKRPLDRHDVGIGHRLPQVLQDGVERLVGMMDDEVLGANGCEHVAAEFANSLRKADVERLEQEVGAISDDQLFGIGQPQQTVLLEHGLLGDLQLVDDELSQVRWHIRVDLQTDDIAAPAPLELRFVGAC